MQKLIFKKIILLCCFLNVHFFALAQSWQQLSDFPSNERDDGVAFVIGSKAFVGTGFSAFGNVTGDFYCLDFNSDAWSPIASLSAGNERQYAVAFSNNTNGFVLGGVNAAGQVLSDLWMYDTLANFWTSKTPKPGAPLASMSSFVFGDTAYVFCGNNNLGISGNDQIWAYSMSTDVWKVSGTIPFAGRWRASTAVCNGKGYLLFGKDTSDRFCKELYEFNPLTFNWQQLSTFSGNGRNYAAIFEYQNSLYVFAGIDTLANCYNDIWKYDLTSNQWFSISNFPSFSRKGGMSFQSLTNFYYTCGIDQVNLRLKETWKISFETAIKTQNTTQIISCYFDKETHCLIIESRNLDLLKINLKVLNLLGNIQTLEIKEATKSKMIVKHNFTGIGVLILSENSQIVASKKLFFQFEN
jgi:N-acetylneuraminic acid mutarotase